MNVENAKRAIREFHNVIQEAQHLETAGAVGGDLDDMLRHATDLLHHMEEALINVDHDQNVELFAAARMLRRQLNQLTGHQTRRSLRARDEASGLPHNADRSGAGSSDQESGLSSEGGAADL